MSGEYLLQGCGSASPHWSSVCCTSLVRERLCSSPIATSHLKCLEEANGIENAWFELELNAIIWIFKMEWNQFDLKKIEKSIIGVKVLLGPHQMQLEGEYSCCE